MMGHTLPLKLLANGTLAHHIANEMARMNRLKAIFVQANRFCCPIHKGGGQ